MIGIFILGMTAVSFVARALDWIDGSDFSAIFSVVGLIGSGLIGIVSKDDDKVDHSAELEDLKKQIEELKQGK